jgi:hypothetical protein
MLRLEIVRTAVPVFVTVRVWLALELPITMDPKLRVVDERLSAGVPSAPVPVSATVWMPLPALLVRVRIPVRLPVAVGVKVTATWQVAPATTDVQPVLASEKSPVAAIFVIARVAPPLLVIVRVCTALERPVKVDGKVRVLAESEIWGEEEVALNVELPQPVDARKTDTARDKMAANRSCDEANIGRCESIAPQEQGWPRLNHKPTGVDRGG